MFLSGWKKVQWKVSFIYLYFIYCRHKPDKIYRVFIHESGKNLDFTQEDVSILENQLENGWPYIQLLFHWKFTQKSAISAPARCSKKYCFHLSIPLRCVGSPRYARPYRFTFWLGIAVLHLLWHATAVSIIHTELSPSSLQRFSIESWRNSLQNPGGILLTALEGLFPIPWRNFLQNPGRILPRTLKGFFSECQKNSPQNYKSGRLWF